MAQVESAASEEQVRATIEQALRSEGGTTVESGPGILQMDLGGSVGAAYLAGGFRGKMKMPMRLVVTTAGGSGGTGVTVEVRGRGTGRGAMSGGLLGASKQRKAEEIWLTTAVNAVPNRIEPVPPAPPPP